MFILVIVVSFGYDDGFDSVGQGAHYMICAQDNLKLIHRLLCTNTRWTMMVTKETAILKVKVQVNRPTDKECDLD